jgi:hypothetical protein
VSDHLMGLVILDPAVRGPNELVVALAIASFADEKGEGINPHLDQLAARARVSETTTRRLLRRLIQRGWLICDTRRVGGRGVATRYRINPEWIKAATPGPFHVEQEGVSTTARHPAPRVRCAAADQSERISTSDPTAVVRRGR